MDKLCKSAVNKMVDEMKSGQNKERIEKEILDPVIKYIGDRLYPYIVSLSIVVSCVFMILVYLVYLSLRLHRTQHLPR